MPRYLTTLLELAEAAGRAILSIYERQLEAVAKPDGSPLTEADLAAHRILTQGLRKAWPDVPVLSEESAHSVPVQERLAWRRLWMVDPLDGTKEFLKRNGQFTVNIALVENSVPVVGVVYAPALGIFYCREADEPARKISSQGHQILPERKWNSCPPIRIVASVSHHDPLVDAFVQEQRQRYGAVEFVQIGSALKICMVAEGAADLYPRIGPTMEWDTAAGHAIALATGCQLRHWKTGEPLVYNKPDLRNPPFLAAPSDYPGWKTA